MTRPQGFSVTWRNYGHWDISQRDVGRVFRLRGGPGSWVVFDERQQDRIENIPQFKEQSAAMAFICAELMHELLTVEGQTPHVMESWNVR